MNNLTLLRSLLVVLTMALSACSSQPDYRAAKGSGYGYAEQQISDNHYRVSFKARGHDSGAAKAYALRRAAELTAAQGYDWFTVIDRQTLTEREAASPNRLGASYQQTTVQNCSLLGCRSRTVSQPHYEAGISSTSTGQVEAVLEIRMGKGVMPDAAAVYPAAIPQKI